MEKQNPKTEEEARQYAMDWQNWMSDEDLSWGEIVGCANEFKAIGKKFDLLDEFKENDII